MPLPFLTYCQMFTTATLTCPRLLVIGYGGGDLHLNTYLLQMRQLRGDELRVGWITRFDDIMTERQEIRQLCAVFAGETHQLPGFRIIDNLTFDADGFAEAGPLLIYNRGFPMRSAADDARLVVHLANGGASV